MRESKFTNEDLETISRTWNSNKYTEHTAMLLASELLRARALLARTEARAGGGAPICLFDATNPCDGTCGECHHLHASPKDAAPVADGAVAWGVEVDGGFDYVSTITTSVENEAAFYGPEHTIRIIPLYLHPQDASGDAGFSAAELESLAKCVLASVTPGGFHIPEGWNVLLDKLAAMQAKEAPNRSAMMRDDEMRGSECEKACDYWLRFKEQDGGMSPWYRCSLEQYARARRQHDSDTCVTKKGETP